MDLSVVIVSYKNPELLRKSLSSLKAHIQNLDAEIIVIDNDSGDGSADVARSYSGVVVEETGENLGFAGGVNRGLARARGRYVLILNPDIEVQGGSLESLVRFMDEHPRTGLAGPKLLNRDGSLQHSCRRFYTLTTILLRRTVLGKLFPRAKPLRDHLMLDYDHAEPRSVDWVAGAAMIVRREAILDVGPMDDRYFLYFEDVDWCRRMHARDWDVHYVPQSVMVHEWQRASSGFSATTGIHIKSGLKFYERWGVLAYLLQWYRRPLQVAGLVAVDAAAIVAAFLLAYLGRQLLAFWLEKPLWPLSFYVSFLTTSLAVFLLTFAFNGLYRERREEDWVDVAFGVAKASTVAFVIVMASTFMLDMRGFSRVLVLGSWPIVMVLTFLNRKWAAGLFERARQERINLQRVAVLGKNPALREAAVKIQEARGAAYEMTTVAVQEPEALVRSLTQERVVAVMLSPADFEGPEALQRMVQALRRAGFRVHVADPVLDALPRQAVFERVYGVNWLTVSRPGWVPTLASKRVLDIVLGVLLAVVFFLPALVRGFAGRFAWYPKLGSVLVGRMSLVGPRAGDESGLRPGLTGLWNIRTSASPQEELHHEMEYQEDWSVEQDLKILVRTGLRCLGVAALLVVLCLPAPAGAQGALDGMTPFLNGYDMRELVQGEDGALWIASTGGALRFDPVTGSWDSFPRLRRGGPAGNDLRSVSLGGDGLLWFGSESRGVSSYDPDQDRWAYFEEVPDDGDGRIQVRVVRAPGDQVFIGTQEGMSLRFVSNRVDVCNAVNDACAVPSYVINDYAKVGDSLWVATQEGLGLHDGTGWVPLEDLPEATQASNFFSMVEYDGALWLATAAGVYTMEDTLLVYSGASGSKLKVSSGNLYLVSEDTVSQWDGEEWSPLFQVALPREESEIRDLEEANGTFYLTTNRGLMRRNAQGATSTLFPPGPAVVGFHNALSFDDEGTLWVGNREGLMSYDGEGWTFLPLGLQGLNGEWIFELLSASGDLIVGHCCCDDPPRCRTDIGDGSQFSILDVYDVWSLDYDGQWAWGGTNNEGAFAFQKSGLSWSVAQQFTVSNSPLASSVVPALAVDSDEAWFGHQSDGVSYLNHGGNLNGGQWGVIDITNGLLDNSVNSLLAAGGGVWIGTSTGIHRAFGSVVLEARRTVLPNVVGDRPRPVRSIVVDDIGNLWLGTSDGILVREVNQSEFRHINTENSNLPSNDIISGVLNPSDGSVWFGCAEGIVRIEPAQVLGIKLTGQSYVLAPNPYEPAAGRVSFYEVESGNAQVPSFDPDTPIDVLDISGTVIDVFDYDGGWTWDGRNANGQIVVPGMYIVRARPAGAEAVLLKLGVVR